MCLLCVWGTGCGHSAPSFTGFIIVGWGPCVCSCLTGVLWASTAAPTVRPAPRVPAWCCALRFVVHQQIRAVVVSVYDGVFLDSFSIRQSVWRVSSRVSLSALCRWKLGSAVTPPTLDRMLSVRVCAQVQALVLVLVPQL